MSISLASLIAVAGEYDEGLDRDTFLRLTMPFIEGGEANAEAFVVVLTAVFRAFCNEGTTIQYPELLIVGLSDLAPATLQQCNFVVHSFAAAEDKGLDRAELSEVIYSILLVRRACLPAGPSAKLRERTVNRMAQTIARSAMGASDHMQAPALLALITGPNLVRALEAATRTLNMKPWVNTMRNLLDIRVGDIARVIDALCAVSADDGRLSSASFINAVADTLWNEEGSAASAPRRERLMEVFSVFDRRGRGEADTDEIAAGITRLACPGSGKATVDAMLQLYGEAVGASVNISELSDFLQATRKFLSMSSAAGLTPRHCVHRCIAIAIGVTRESFVSRLTPLTITASSSPCWHTHNCVSHWARTSWCARTTRTCTRRILLTMAPLASGAGAGTHAHTRSQALSRRHCSHPRSASTTRSSKQVQMMKRVASWQSSTSTEQAR